MNPAEIIQTAMDEGLDITLSPGGKIKATGEQSVVNHWLSILRENKAEIVKHLVRISNESAAPLPSWCRADCSCLDVIPGLGPGCVRQLPPGPWREEWQRLEKLESCPKMAH